jgi:hypothetical protein
MNPFKLPSDLSASLSVRQHGASLERETHSIPWQGNDDWALSLESPANGHEKLITLRRFQVSGGRP